jgi:hypothetical protein
MRKFLFFLVVVVVCVVAVGIYRGWFEFTKRTDPNSGKVDVGLTIDENKIKEDTAKAKEKAKEATEKAKERIDENKTAPTK